jgi:hypothetical protein
MSTGERARPDHPATRSCRQARFPALMALGGAAWLLGAGAAAAQPATRDQARAPRWFAEGAVILCGSGGAPKDPEGPGYLSPYFHGTVEWPAIGGLAGAGVFLTRNWTASAEVAAHWPASGVISEDSRTHSERTTVTSTYREQHTMVSLVAGWNPGPWRTVTLRPLLGMTVASSRQSLTGRTGEYSWYGGTLPVARPDASLSIVQVGGVVGADLQRRFRGSLSLTAVVRAHWIRRPANALPYRDAPAMGPVILYIGAGACWTR